MPYIHHFWSVVTLRSLPHRTSLKASRRRRLLFSFFFPGRRSFLFHFTSPRNRICSTRLKGRWNFWNDFYLKVFAILPFLFLMDIETDNMEDGDHVSSISYRNTRSPSMLVRFYHLFDDLFLLYLISFGIYAGVRGGEMAFAMSSKFRRT